jgi:hypothetical protein
MAGSSFPGDRTAWSGPPSVEYAKFNCVAVLITHRLPLDAALDAYAMFRGKRGGAIGRAAAVLTVPGDRISASSVDEALIRLRPGISRSWR